MNFLVPQEIAHLQRTLIRPLTTTCKPNDRALIPLQASLGTCVQMDVENPVQARKEE